MLPDFRKKKSHVITELIRKGRKNNDREQSLYEVRWWNAFHLRIQIRRSHFLL